MTDEDLDDKLETVIPTYSGITYEAYMNRINKNYQDKNREAVVLGLRCLADDLEKVGYDYETVE